MRSIVLCAALLAAASPAVAAPHSSRARAAAPAKATEPSKKNDFDFAKMMAVFDKIFPAQPDPAPERLALSRVTVQGLFPDGTYSRLMGSMMHGMMDRVMALSPAEFGANAGKPADTTTLREQLMKEDPSFEERMKITERVVGEEMGKIAGIIEPRMREGLARSMARRLDEKQLRDINAFLATDSGKAFGSQSMAMWVDPDVFRAMMNSAPEMMVAMPAALQRIEAETAHLPKSKGETKATVKPKS